MQIILGEEHAHKIREKYIVLELDTFLVEGKVVMDYCEKIGTARANRYLKQHPDIARYLTQNEKNFK